MRLLLAKNRDHNIKNLISSRTTRKKRILILGLGLAFILTLLISLVQLQKQISTPQLVVRLQTNPSNELAIFSPNGKVVVTTESNTPKNYLLNLWDATNGEKLKSFSQETPVHSAAFSPDSRFLVTGGWDGTTNVWDLVSDKLITELRHEKQALISNVYYRSDGRTILTEDAWGTYLWDSKTGDLLNQFLSAGYVSKMAYSPITQQVAIAKTNRDYDHSDLCIGYLDWDNADLQCVEFKKAIFAVAWSPDGSQLAIGSNSSVFIWDPTKGQETQNIDYDDWVLTVNYDPSGHFLIIGGNPNSLVIYDTLTWQQSLVLRDCSQTPCLFSRAFFSPDRHSLLVYKSDQWSNFVEIWNLPRALVASSSG